MLQRTPFLQFLAPRIGRVQQDLNDLIWQLDATPLPVTQSPAIHDHLPIAEADTLTYSPITKYPHHWGKMFEQCFWQLDLSAVDTTGKYLFWADQGEATAYDGQMPLFGFDPGHKYQPIPKGIKQLTLESICARTGIWVTNEKQGITAEGSRFEGAFLATRNETAWAMSHDLKVLLDLAVMLIERDTDADSPLGRGGYRKPFDHADPLAKKIIVQLDKACEAFERGNLQEAASITNYLMTDLRGKGDDTVKLILTGHAHIDLVWLWPENAGDFKATHSFANALNLMDRYPEFIFGYSQPASYDAMDKRSPKLMEAITEKVKAGKFEHAGATYVESDTQLPCGENLLRAFEVGQDDLMQRFGTDTSILWIPDVFGYSACIPQLMAGFGVKYFYTTKQHWSSGTQFPYSSFRWVGHDGTEVLTHVSWRHYNMAALPEEARYYANQHRQAGVHDEALMPTGYGDGGGGTSAEMLERARRMADLAGYPQMKWGRVDQFFDRMAEKRDELPQWRGEIYLEFHRGVQTSEGHLKHQFRRAERALQTWEAAHAVLGKGSIDLHSWKRLIFAQFHDYIPGSSIPRVYEETVPELKAIADDALNATSQALGNDGDRCLFNPLPMNTTAKVCNEIVELPALSGIKLSDAKRVDGKVFVEDTKLQSQRVSTTINSRGEVTELVIDGNAIDMNRPLGEVWSFNDIPNIYDAWELERHTFSTGTHLTDDAQIKFEGDGSASASISFTRNFAKASSITVRYRLDANSPVLRVETDIDLQDKQALVKLVFPTDYQGKNAIYGAPFGATLRPQHPGPIATESMFEVPGSRWAVVCDDSQRDGMMLMTESRYGFGCLSGMMHVSLVRSPKVTPTRGDADTTSFGINKSMEVSNLGKHHVELAIGYFNADAPRELNPAALAESLFRETVAYEGKPVTSPLQALEGGNSLIPTWIKPMADGSMLLRLNETLGQRGTMQIKLAEGYKASITDLRGEPTGEASSELNVAYRPYMLTTVRISQ
ncbi:MAG TPA: hypothetical protein DCM28_22960 [Phycisphaerales bacterium]|nr:hypothetical protein [Phycisphaerales bacterium]HCD33342.1 hypothetical protein [Phycisphaerales bacterium]|tara:strand:+ start:15253 stop:18255 length:3003 start_codon:yes stop_codon:yes gene_type:complete